MDFVRKLRISDSVGAFANGLQTFGAKILGLLFVDSKNHKPGAITISPLRYTT
jgi:hypothetical protein